MLIHRLSLVLITLKMIMLSLFYRMIEQHKFSQQKEVNTGNRSVALFA